MSVGGNPYPKPLLAARMPLLAFVAGTVSVLGQSLAIAEPPDEALWREIKTINASLQDIPPYQPDVAASLAPRQRLLDRTRFYLTAYPGGRRRDAAIRLELKNLFDIGVLRGGDFSMLDAQTRIYMERPPSRPALHEAAYWKIRCEYVNAADANATDSIARHDPALLAAYRNYVSAYPRSRHVPRMTDAIFAAAENAGDVQAMRAIAANMERDFPKHLTLEHMRGRLRLRDAVGKPFTLQLTLSDGLPFDIADWRGSPVLIVVWASFDENSTRLADEIEAFRIENPDFRVIGISLDSTNDRRTERGSSSWPRSCDGLGWAGEFVRNWGIREIPTVFVLERKGVLAGWSNADGWRRLANDLRGN